MSKNNIDQQVQANAAEFDNLPASSKPSLSAGGVFCIKPALRAGIGPSNEVSKARESQNAFDDELDRAAEANSEQPLTAN